MSSATEEKEVTRFLCIPVSFKFLKRKKRQAQELAPLEKLGDDQTAADPVKTLERELVEERAKVARLEAERDTSAEEKGRLEDENRKARELLEAREKEASQKAEDVRRLEREAGVLREQLIKLQAADARAEELSARLADKEKLLNERTTELNAAQVFLTKVDAVSEAEVVGMVDNLNTLICQTSGALSDAWDQREPIPGTLVEESDLEQIRNDFGDLMAERIADRDPVAVNLAIQMYLGRFVEQITSGWGGGQAAGRLAEIYGMISAEESQTIASRWRTLTKRYSPHKELPESDVIISGLARILVVTQSFSDFSEATDSVSNSAGSEIKAIIEATVELDDTIKTKIASSDMSVYIVSLGTAFSEETMEDEIGEGPKVEGEPVAVAGTMEIGLLQRLEKVEKVLRKPKVILERDLIEPEGGGRE